MPDQNLSEILGIMACPACKSPLELRERSLLCSECRRAYPINDAGIPILLIEESIPMQPGE